jgi:hypothetical protein
MPSEVKDVTPLAPTTPEEGAVFERLLNQQLWGQDTEPSFDDLRAGARRALGGAEVCVGVDETPLGVLPPEDR